MFVSTGASDKKAEIRESVISAIVKDMPEYYSPKNIYVIDSMPITSSQKIDYHALEKMQKNKIFPNTHPLPVNQSLIDSPSIPISSL